MRRHTKRGSATVNAGVQRPLLTDPLAWQGTLRRYSFYLFPAQCLICRRYVVGDCELCDRCFDRLPRHAEPFYQITRPAAMTVFAPFRYEKPVNQWILKLKFPPYHRHLGWLLGQLLVAEIEHHQLALPTALLPIPLHINRLRARGFNQSQEIANSASYYLQRPVLSANYLQRVKDTEHNSRLLDADSRAENLKDAFQLRRPLPLSLALIDDVFTTGVTFRSVLQAVRDQDDPCVLTAWAIARSRG